MSAINPWPLCKCGHIAQDHNTVRAGFVERLGCDRLGCDCVDYTFPDGVTAERRAALEARRAEVLKSLKP
jgi:hypothetical protein